ncbi:hypothetical protein F1737_04645 [Methanoplanus sp. FWC-SCC4]|uniref:Uncharacterized protein n=1 Tax=Methanochimaera problematica TaxID=2609417 RepID=A0AA97FDI0_9EURY|nr:hypothetical protein [Methanoplanus sp. FWC-SCC4]WOF16043.1 hypothetical protein F1737_04645 [Methanoplanus sp. FWC-SCC4]
MVDKVVSAIDNIAQFFLAVIICVSGVFSIFAVLLDHPVIGIWLVNVFILADVSFNHWKKVSQLNREKDYQLTWEELSQLNRKKDYQLTREKFFKLNQNEVSQLNLKELSRLKKYGLTASILFLPLFLVPTLWFLIFGQSYLFTIFNYEWAGAALPSFTTIMVVTTFFLLGLFVVLPWLSGLISKMGIYHASDREYLEEEYRGFIKKCKRFGKQFVEVCKRLCKQFIERCKRFREERKLFGFVHALNSYLDFHHESDMECFRKKCKLVGFVYALISVPLIISYLMYLRSFDMQFDLTGAVLVMISTTVTLLVIRINSNPSKDRINRPEGVTPKQHDSLIKTHKERILSFLFSLIFAQWILTIIALTTVIRQDSEFKFGTEPSIVWGFIALFLVVLIFATYIGERILRWRHPHDQIYGRNYR